MDTDKRKIAYEIDDVVLVEPFKVYKSANAWWMEKIKVQQLIEGFKKAAYEIDDVVLVEPFKVYKSANAWWMEKIKVQHLMEGFKKAYTIKEALILAGISEIEPKKCYSLTIFSPISVIVRDGRVGLPTTVWKTVVLPVN